MIEFFESMNPALRFVVFVSGIAFFASLEAIIPLFSYGSGTKKHLSVNLSLIAVAVAINLVLATPLVLVCKYVSTHQIGLIHLKFGPLWLKYLLAFFILDFTTSWFAHWVFHKIPALFKFHAIHHIDQQVGATSALRQHPVETVLRAAFTVPAILISGAPLGLLLMFQTSAALMGQFNHANIKLPTALDKFLSLVLVSPNFHKVHHHMSMPLTDSNYGTIFSLWDRVFKTHTDVKPETIVYGLDLYMEQGRNERFGELMALPIV